MSALAVETDVRADARRTIDGMLRLVSRIRAEKHRDPLVAIEDALLDMRTAVGD